jgi:hypothetical protein
MIVTDLEAGESVRGIARKYHLHRSTVVRNLRKAGVAPQRPEGVAGRPELVAEARRLRGEGLSLRGIANVTADTRHPLRRLRPGRQRRLGRGRIRPRHLGVRSRHHRRVVGRHRQSPLPRRDHAADLR